MLFRDRWFFVCLLAASQLVGCGTGTGGDAPGGGTSNSNPNPDPAVYLTYAVSQRDLNGNKVTTSLGAVDSEYLDYHQRAADSPNGLIKILGVQFQTGSYDSNGYSISHYHMSHLPYTKSGRLFVLPVYQVRSIEPLQLSNETNLTACADTAERGNDYAVQSNSRILYQTFSDPSQCGKGGGWRMVSLSMDASSNPVSLPSTVDRIVTSVHDEISGALTGWVVVDGGVLKRYDTDFTNGASILASGAPVPVNDHASLLVRTRHKHFLLLIDNSIYLYDPTGSGNTITGQPLFQEQPGFHLHRFVSDGDRLYFSIKQNSQGNTSNLGVSRLFSVNISVGATAEPVVEEPNGIGAMVVTDNFIFYTYDVNNNWPRGTKIKRLDKSSRQIQALNGPANTDGVSAIYADRGYVFTEWSAGDTKSVWVLNETDTTGTVHTNHRVVGLTYEHVLDPTRETFHISKLILLDESTAGAARLRSFSPYTGELVAEIGTLPPEAHTISLEFFWARGHDFGLFSLHTPNIFDLFFYNASTDDSLRRVTDTLPVNEKAIHQKPGAAR